MTFKLLTPVLFLLLVTFSCSKKQPIMQIVEQTPWGEEVFTLPQFLEDVYSIEDYNAKSQAGFNNQQPIQKAINECSNNGGGMVLIPEGDWETSYLKLKSNVNLHLSKGAVLSFSDSIPLYNVPTFTRWEGMECMNYHPLIYAKDEKNIAITGQGKILGNGQKWWYMKELTKKTLSKLYDQVEANVPPEKRNCLTMTETSYLRPQLIQLINCETVQLDGFEIGSGPFWTVHLVYCENVVASNLTVITDGVNNDGIIPDSSSKVLIRNCFFSTGDDCIVIKSGLNEDGWRVNKPTKNVVVRNCFTEYGHGGVVIGSEMSGGVENIVAHNCTFNNTERGLRIKSMRGRGGYVRNIYFYDIEMNNIKSEAIMVNMRYPSSSVQPRGNRLPKFANINIHDITSKHATYGIKMQGLSDNPIEGIFMENILCDSSTYGMGLDSCKNLQITNVEINSSEEGLFKFEANENIELENVIINGKIISE